ncbi:hypothetical protein DFQ26_008121 [Actinomortierella ambigua]|nr:hypothetical protein DFQ26_008121 [Actinomortierella ambigua]
MKFTASVFAVTATLLATASAHVTINPPTGTSGGYSQGNFRVPHGCSGNATDQVIVQIPKDVTSVKPRALPPWTTTINMVPLDVPIQTESGTINTTVGSVTWSGGNLPDSFYEDFGLQFKLPKMNGTLYWNVYQHCVNGEWLNWTQVPGPDGKYPPNGAPAASMTVLNTTAGSSSTTPNTSEKDVKSGVAQLATSSVAQAIVVGAGALIASLL